LAGQFSTHRLLATTVTVDQQLKLGVLSSYFSFLISAIPPAETGRCCQKLPQPTAIMRNAYSGCTVGPPTSYRISHTIRRQWQGVAASMGSELSANGDDNSDL
jgi:hypothetical protein